MKKFLFILFLGFSSSLTFAQVVAGVPDDLVECDVTNPGDQTEVFDLTQTEEAIINGQSNVVVTYHLTSGDALSGFNALPNPEGYTNIANPEPIFARLQSTAGQGWSITSFSLIVPLIAEIQNPPQDLFVNDGDGNSQGIFDLTVNEATVLGNQDPFNFQFSYYESLANASNYTNPITNPENYQNSSNPQTIYGRIDALQLGCQFTLFQFSLQADGPLGTSENSFEEDFRLYPNPSKNNITMFSKTFVSEVSLKIYTLSGMKVFSERFLPNAGKILIDLTPFESGIYVIQISSEGNSITKKLIKV
ncbi:MAG: T9SS type A sorting domain-containing protein [Flavobacteriaceae bacterium]